jgi:hypothetical protein
LVGEEAPRIQSTTVHRRTGDLFSKDGISVFNMLSISAMSFLLYPVMIKRGRIILRKREKLDTIIYASNE